MRQRTLEWRRLDRRTGVAPVSILKISLTFGVHNSRLQTTPCGLLIQS
jgi:hypothetical protein